MTNEQIETKFKERKLETLHNRLDKLIAEISSQEVERDVQIERMSQSDKDLSKMIEDKKEVFEKSIASLKQEIEIVVELIRTESN